MKLLTLADLHLDLHSKKQVDPFENVPDTHLQDITHCVLAGDLSNKGYKQWPRFLPWVAEKLPNAQIFVMPGNHDYYDGSIDREDKLRDAAVASNVTFSQKSELICGQQRLLCCTLWTDFEIYGDRVGNMRHAVNHMNDYQAIRVAQAGYKKVTPAQTARIHTDHCQWLNDRLSETFDGQTTVITHHAPHINALKDTPAIGPCYASDLTPMILKHQPDRWFFGHTHYAVSFEVGKTVLRNVSVGYPDQLAPIDNLERFVIEQ